MSALAKLPTFACPRVGVNRATCDSALHTKEEDRKNKEVQEEETDERRHWGRGGWGRNRPGGLWLADTCFFLACVFAPTRTNMKV